MKYKSQVTSTTVITLLMLFCGACTITLEENSITGTANTVEDKNETKQDVKSDIQAKIPAL